MITTTTDDMHVILAETPHGHRYYAVVRGDELHTVPGEDVVATFGPWLYERHAGTPDEVARESISAGTDYRLLEDGGWVRDDEGE